MALYAPWLIISFLILAITGYIGTVTSSSTFPIRSATFLTSPSLIASIIASISGCFVIAPASRLSYTIFVETLIGGLATTIWQCGIGESFVSFSPIPSASAVPLIMQYGTSAPILTPCFISSSLDKPSSKSLLIANIVDAASVLPPAIPAAIGMNLLRSTSIPPLNPYSSFISL